MTEYVLACAHPTFSQNLGITYEVVRLRMEHSDDRAAIRWMRVAVLCAYNLNRDGVGDQALPLRLWRASLPTDVLIWEPQED
jgi:hypothetical protein